MKIRKKWVINLAHRYFVFNFWKEHGFGLSFNYLPYRYVRGISSKTTKRTGVSSVVFGDYEKPINAEKIRTVMREEGVSLLVFFKSSRNKYHFISPQIFSWLDALRISQRLGCEKNYLSISSVRQEFILRISRKGSKDEPKVHKVFHMNTPANMSLAHVNFLIKWYGLNRQLFDGQKMLKSGLGPLIEGEQYKTTNI